MPSWMPGDEYLTNFQKGDPYIKVDEGYARLPGKGYEAIHPEVAGIDPEHYSDMSKMRILADVAPYSREYQRYAAIVGKTSQGNAELRAEYERNDLMPSPRRIHNSRTRGKPSTPLRSGIVSNVGSNSKHERRSDLLSLAGSLSSASLGSLT